MSIDGFRVTVKDSAVEVNRGALELSEASDDVITYPSRQAAVTATEQLSADGGRVRIQSVAPQDPMPVDGYIVADPERRVRQPEGDPSGGFTFETGAVQYGALGEALVCAYRRDPPLLSHFVRRDLDLDPGDPMTVEIDRDPEPLQVNDPADGSTAIWIPDCLATATGGPDGDLDVQYLCEIKTGSASYERGQRTAMGLASADRRVLAIRLDIRDLPDRYTATVESITPSFADRVGVSTGPTER